MPEIPGQQKLVVDERLTKPSAVSPTLFVGLGGCGCRIVARLAAHLRRRHDYEERYKALVKFALVDTNVSDLESYREIANATFLISDFEKEQYANLASGKLFLEEDPYFTQWVPPSYRFRAGDTAGAGQIRIESRLGVFYQMKHKDFVPRLRQLLEELKSHEHGHRRLDSSEIRIVLCYSIAGGTGSGSHLPMAYLLRDLAREMGKPWLIGVAVMPSVFEDKTRTNKDGTFANGYAALKETEHLMKLGAPDSSFYPADGIPFHYNPRDESKKTVRERPFEFVYLIDKPESFSVPEPVDAAADGLYLQFFSPLLGWQLSDYDNYTQHQRFLVPHDFEAKGIPGFTTFYGSYGAAVLLVPVAGLVQYCSQAAALTLMRANFLHDVPAEPIYGSLRANRQIFDEVTPSDERNERPIHVSELVKKERLARDVLYNRLFMRRVQLLAACELREGQEGPFLALLRHGHRLGDRPLATGGFEPAQDKARLKLERPRLADQRMRYSINAIVLQALAGEQPKQQPGLLVHARQAIEELADGGGYQVSTDMTVGQLKNLAASWKEDFKNEGTKVVRRGYRVGDLSFPGMDALVDLDFLKDEAGAVNLAAKRYAVLRVLDELGEIGKPPDRPGDFDVGPDPETKKLKARDAGPTVDALRSQAIDHALAEVTRDFLERLGDLKVNLNRYAQTHRTLESGYDELEREQSKSLAKLREEGDPSANQYVLDAEALLIESGRRLWDFYYEDKIAPLPELHSDNRQIQQVLSDTITDLSVSGVGSTTATLQKLFDTLKATARRILEPHVAGDPQHGDRERREGLTLSDALELEVVYRALYLSDAEAVEQGGQRAIRDVVARYRTLEPERQEKLDKPVHTDYLRDKVKRVVKEKASLLCVYEESRDQHGGVRPDHVFLAAIDENFKNGTIEEALKGADIPNLEWVTTGWHNPKEIIFYRAVLNVPLYVFGRLRDMQHDYREFKGRARRSKVLHVDKNWEDSLVDLDPEDAKERHRQTQVRNHIIDFAALLTLGGAAGSRGCIVRRNGHYYLVDPNAQALPAADGEDGGGALAPLGATLAASIERLPEVLEGERVKYLSYQQSLTAIRRGYAPEVLKNVARLPFLWRRNRDELRTQYGSHPAKDQQDVLRDYANAFEGLRESLDDLLGRLRNHEIEQRTMGEDAGDLVGLERDQAAVNLRQSVEILRAFSETWARMENPEEAREIPATFRRLFNGLDEGELDRTLQLLRAAYVQAPPAGGPTPSRTP